MYSVAVVASQSKGDALLNAFVIASNQESALEQALVTLREESAESKTGRWRVVTSSVKQIDRDLLEQAATEILGWSAP
jgi:hypothetical protein